MKTLKLVVTLIFVSLYAFAGNHPEANFGDYGIRHYPTISDYRANYIGQIVKYLPSGKDGKGRYNDQKGFLDAGGNFDSEYVISKIIGNDKRMTFLLTEVTGNKKVKMIVNNQEEHYSFGKYTYCITDSYTIPLFLVGKFNQDKENFVGQSFGVGTTKLEVTDVLIKPEYVTYPKVVFEITDKSDGEKSFVDFENIHDMAELGKVFTHSLYKCHYTVVGIATEKNYKIYTVKNSINGITKQVGATTARIDAFKGDDSGKFVATLTKVEKPSDSSVRYGNTTTVTDKDVTKFSYVDNFIDILIFAANSQFGFALKNVSDNTLKVVWNEAVFVDVDGSTSKVMHSGIKYSQREAEQPASTIIKGAKLDDIAAPTANIYYSDALKEWTSYSMYRNADKNKQGQSIKLMLPIQVKDVINEYVFEFGLTYVFDHPEYLVE